MSVYCSLPFYSTMVTRKESFGDLPNPVYISYPFMQTLPFLHQPCLHDHIIFHFHQSEHTLHTFETLDIGIISATSESSSLESSSLESSSLESSSLEAALEQTSVYGPPDWPTDTSASEISGNGQFCFLEGWIRDHHLAFLIDLDSVDSKFKSGSQSGS